MDPIAPEDSNGFVASRLVLANAYVAAICQGLPVTRPSAYSVEFAPGTQSFWPVTLRFRAYRMESKRMESKLETSGN